MNRLFRLSTSAVVVASALLGGEARAQVVARVSDAPLRIASMANYGSLEGFIRDDQGLPVSGATVSAIGPTNLVTIADTQGRFQVRSVPPGPYQVRAHLVGYNPSRRQIVDVRPAGRTTIAVAMQRIDSAKLLAAGFGPDQSAANGKTGRTSTAGGGNSSDDQSELAWRLRHLTRTVLKDATDRVVLTGAEDGSDPGSSAFTARGMSNLARAVGSSARFASTLFGNLALTGEVNLLTSGSFDSPVDLLNVNQLARGVAYFNLRGRAGDVGRWSVQALATQATLGAWMIAGTFDARVSSAHRYELGASYTAQRYVAGTGSLASPLAEGDRAAGAIYGVDRWSLSPKITLSYGARYARYDYVDGIGLFSPAVTIAIVPAANTRILASISRRDVAPGAEEFTPPSAAGLWVPPSRTFATMSPNEAFVPERTLHYELGFERNLWEGLAVAVRGFYQQVADQQATLFAGVFDHPIATHYVVGRVGDVMTRGVSVGMTNTLTRYLRGSVTYEYTDARWSNPAADVAIIALVSPSLSRRGGERLHDLSTAIETEIPRTSTRFLVLYKVNTGFGRRDGDEARPGFSGRFDVQMTQRLRFLDFTSAEWQVLVAVRNLFHDPNQFSSIYDELFVVRPPKRIVGGVLVRF